MIYKLQAFISYKPVFISKSVIYSGFQILVESFATDAKFTGNFGCGWNRQSRN